jgi:hypothetical protein
MKRALLLAVLLVLIFAGAGRAELFGIGGGLSAYPLDLRGLKGELEELGAPTEDLAGIPDLLPLPHLGLRGRLGLPGPIGVQLEVARLGFDLPLGEELSLNLNSTMIGFSLLGELKALFIGLVLGIGTDLIQGELGLSSSDSGTEALLEQLGLTSLPWSAATIHGLGELELILGPLRFYLEGKYLYPLSQSGLGIGSWEVGLGLMIVI